MIGKGKQEHPCRRCVYFNACGDGARTLPCPQRKEKDKKSLIKMIFGPGKRKGERDDR